MLDIAAGRRRDQCWTVAPSQSNSKSASQSAKSTSPISNQSFGPKIKQTELDQYTVHQFVLKAS